MNNVVSHLYKAAAGYLPSTHFQSIYALTYQISPCIRMHEMLWNVLLVL